jgi:steroid 5-alpha reductase family enzyme
MKKFILFLAAVAALFFLLTFIFFGRGFISSLSDANPLITMLLITASQIVASFIFSLATGDYSWVDRMWSTAPILYAWVYAVRGWFDPRLVIAAGLVTIWGLRLTFNFARKGGYTGMEDYRWPVLRKRITKPVLWQLFNFGFISLFQISLFMLFTLPLYRIFLQPGIAPALGFYITAFFFLFFLVFETIADQQQWRFHQVKHSISAGEYNVESAGDGKSGGNSSRGRGSISRKEAYARDAEEGFLQSGLFRISRHPNYFGELAIWWTFFVMGVLHAGAFLHWSLVGPLLLTAVFFGSTRFTEAISSSKYPGYAIFRKTTSAVIPWFPRERTAREETASAVID